MSWTDKIVAMFRREAKDVEQGLDNLKDKFDAGLTKREQELAATPAEKMQMIQNDIEKNESRMDEIAFDEVSTLDEAVSRATTDAHASTPDPATEVDTRTVHEIAEDTLEELRAELGLDED